MSAATPAPHRPAASLCLALATGLPPLVAFNQTPAATLYNQLLALAGWGLALAVCARFLPRWRAGLTTPAGLALVLLCVAPWVSLFWRGLPSSLALGSAVILLAGLVVFLLAQGLPAATRPWVADAFCWGLLLAGGASIAISAVQVFAPEWADGTLIARSGIPGRGVGNLRQPNHLASLMMWTAVAAVWLTERRRAPAAALAPLLFACVFTVVLSASRTGFIGVAMLALWGLVDRQLSRPARLALLATPVMLGLSWWLMAQWSAEGHAFGAASRLSEGAGSPSRLAILHDAWALTRANPWLGVGWGEFNFAWTLTPFPNRPIAFFDHTHNLPSQLAVELGLPWAGAVLALLGWGLWQAWRGAARPGPEAPLRRAALMLVLAIGLHSLLEYPLWYAYFLLPACFALGLALPARADDAPATSPAPWQWVGGLLMAGSLFAVWDYQRIVAIYAPAADDAPLSRRIAAGQHSVFFSHQADYAAATSLPPGQAALDATRRTAFSLIDARLMMHWSRSLEAVGDVDGARFLADRLREFRNPTGDTWFASCPTAASLTAAASGAMPQCQPASDVRDWRRLR
ncbi:PglL family O-oligosaccharyltransferase [Roseateles sp. BYS87W]|uniref:Wzy polymerase domain-containing protein n=1 Tax=Pelomonas baiyunensis TaxID=3299026 RepID=A0ABW7GZ74_9BURK